jgi:hypothetical protein
MKNPFIVKPTGLKGVDKLNRMKELMGSSLLNEDVKKSVVELTKLGPDGKVYGIVREGHNYFIKVTNKKSNILTEDFNYIGGLMNKTSEVYPSYAKALKQLNLKFISLNEAYGKTGNFNIFEDDNLLNEHHPYNANQKLSATKGMGDGAEYIVDKKGSELSYDSKEGKEEGQFGDNVAEKDVEDEFEKVKLSENEMAIDRLLVESHVVVFDGTSYYVTSEGDVDSDVEVIKKFDDIDDADEFCDKKNKEVNESKKGRFSISKAIDLMEDIVDESDKDIKVKGKDVKNAKQNGDKSYTVTFSDDTTEIIYVSHDDWDKLNGKYGNVNENLTKKNMIKFINSLTESEKKALLNTLKKKV